MNCHMKNFIQDKQAIGRSHNTIVYYQSILNQFYKFFPGWPPTYQIIVLFLNHKRETCNETSLYKYHKGLKSFLNWCEKHGQLADNPMHRMDNPTKPGNLPRPASAETIQALFKTLEHHAQFGDKMALRDRALFRLAYDTGCRATELASIKLSALDLTTGGVLIKEGKGKKDRTVYFGLKCKLSLRYWLNNGHPGGVWLFPSRLRVEIKPITRRAVLYSVKKWAKIAGVDGDLTTAHQIRHTYATHALRQGIDLGLIQHQMGHTRLSTTAIYLAVEDTQRRKAHQSGVLGDRL